LKKSGPKSGANNYRDRFVWAANRSLSSHGANGGVAKAAAKRREEQQMKLRNTQEAAAYLQDRGHPGASAFRLKQLRTEGGGPEYRKCGRFVRYEQQALDDWAASRMSEPRRSTSEAA
jgi:hypothetical protein